MDFPNIDLYGLAAFDAIRRTGSITQAALELNLAQSTLSNRLRRLRSQLDDPLFIRTAAGMQPTPFAEDIGARISDALAMIDGGLRNRKDFDPGREARTFTILMTPVTEVQLVPLVVDRCAVEAPGMNFTTRALPDKETENALREGVADLAIGYFPDISQSLKQRHVVNSDYVCVVSKNHPTIGDTISREQFLGSRYAIADVRGTGHHAVELALQRAGVATNIVARVSNFLSLSLIVASSTLIATIPGMLANTMQHAADIKVLRHPLDLPTPEVRQFWHDRVHRDPAHVWLRGILSDLYRSLPNKMESPA